jgi:hypothetical protein
MATSISRALARIKDDLEPFLPDDAIAAACAAAGHRWRDRKLGPVATVHLFVLQVLNFNTAIANLRHLAGHAVNAAAYCEARMRLPLAALQALSRSSSAAMRAAAGGRRRHRRPGPVVRLAAITSKHRGRPSAAEEHRS